MDGYCFRKGDILSEPRTLVDSVLLLPSYLCLINTQGYLCAYVCVCAHKCVVSPECMVTPVNEERGTNMDFPPSVSQGTGQSPIESP